MFESNNYDRQGYLVKCSSVWNVSLKTCQQLITQSCFMIRTAKPYKVRWKQTLCKLCSRLWFLTVKCPKSEEALLKKSIVDKMVSLQKWKPQQYWPILDILDGPITVEEYLLNATKSVTVELDGQKANHQITKDWGAPLTGWRATTLKSLGQHLPLSSTSPLITWLIRKHGH